MSEGFAYENLFVICNLFNIAEVKFTPIKTRNQILQSGVRL